MSESMRDSVKGAIIWRSGSQIIAQTVAWSSTLLVMRILDPADYGIFAMTAVIMALLSFLGGYGFAGSLIQARDVDSHKIRQAFGLLLLINGGIALTQFTFAPLAANYFQTPIVTDLLRVQALIYLSMPFAVLPEILLTREMDFKRPAIANLISTAISASVALGCALAELGVWTLVYAPLAAFWSRALVLMVAARFTFLPIFDLRGAGKMFNFGLLVLASQFFWTIVTQADIFIAGRVLPPRELGYYAEAMLLTAIVAVRFVPALNEVAFPAYARLQDDMAALRYMFLKAVRLIMLATCPLYFGLLVTAPEMVAVVLGPKWLPMAPLVSVLALAMPAFTLQSLFSPVLNAIGRPGIPMQSSMIGAAVVGPSFLFAVQWGTIGLAWVWVLVFPVLPLSAFILSRRVLALAWRDMAGALAPGLVSSALMALTVYSLAHYLPVTSPYLRLPLLVSAGGVFYAGLLYIFARPTLMELLQLVLRRRTPAAVPAE